MPKIIYYRNKCIGCGVCYEQQPALWRMSKKDGKATLVKSLAKRHTYVLTVSKTMEQQANGVAVGCPVKIIKVL